MSAQATILYNGFENFTFKIVFISTRGEWVNTFSNPEFNVDSSQTTWFYFTHSKWLETDFDHISSCDI